MNFFTNAYASGVAAANFDDSDEAEDGLPSDCPYTEGSQAAADWWQGYKDQQREIAQRYIGRS